MKKAITLSALLSMAVVKTFAQPAINDTSNIAPVGMGDSISVLTSAVSPGPAGANQTWDFSALVPQGGGYAQYVDPASTPYAASYPAATRAVKIDIPAVGTIYEYDIVSATKWEMLAGNVTASTADDYSANPKTMIPIPFHYGDNVTDTFYKNAVGPYTVTMSYDGYGTLVTPFATYTNVVRMKRSFGGNDYYYDWYTTSPYLEIVVSYDNNTSKYTFIGTGTTGIKNSTANKTTVQVYPDPLTETATVSVNTTQNMNGAKLILTDITGRKLKEMPADKPRFTFSRDGLQAGLYLYSIYNNSTCLANGRILIQ
ncbi:MAG: hypothetical protein BGO69_00440 [Bacteroidetes bacterium 46-16]|nr:MAG: hypothetical protein BGO69_00440 [Bacteroidetes bacterium 46-16]